MMSLSFAKFEDEINSLAKLRNPLLEPLSDFELTAEEAKKKIAAVVDAILLNSPQENRFDLWKEPLFEDFDYKFEANEENLNEESVIAKMGEFIDKVFPPVESLAEISDEEAVVKEYFAGIETVYAKLERLMKLELINQFVNMVKSKGNGKLGYLGTVVAEVQDLITAEANQLIANRQIRPTAALEEVKVRLGQIHNSIKDGYLSQVQQVIDLYFNRLANFRTEIKLALILIQVGVSKVSQETITGKIEFLMDRFAGMASSAGEPKLATDLINQFNDYIAASRRGSVSVSLRFKEIIPSVISCFINSIGNRISLADSFKVTKMYLRSVSGAVSNSDVKEWFREYVAGGENLPNVEDPSSSDFKKEAIKVSDIVRQLDFDSAFSGWWKSVLPHMREVLEEVSAEDMELNDLYKLVTSNNLMTYSSQPDYFKNLYDLLVEFFVSRGSQVGEARNWNLKFLDFVDQKFPNSAFIQRYYAWIKVHILLFRSSNEGQVHFVEFVQGNEENFGLFKDWVSKLSEIVRVNYLEELKKPHKEAGGKNTKKNNEALVYLSFWSGKNLLVSAFPRVATNVDFGENIVEFGEDQLKKKKIEIEIKEGQANDKLNELDPKKQGDKEPKKDPAQEIQADLRDNKLEPFVPSINTPKRTDDGLGGLDRVDETSNPGLKDVEEERKEPTGEEETNNKENNLKDLLYIGSPIGSGTPIKVADEPIPIERSEEELENLVDLVKGSLDPVTLEAFQRNPDMIDLIEKVQIQIDPVTGEETYIHYIQVVPKNSACFETIHE